MFVRLLFCIFLICANQAMAQSKTVELHEMEIGACQNHSWTIPETKTKWSSNKENQLDSVLFKAGFFNILVYKKDRETVYSILQRYNPSLTSNYRFSFPADSLSAWKQHPTQVPSVHVCKYMHKGIEWHYQFRPATPMNYNDARINDFPLVTQGVRCKTVTLNNRIFKISQNDNGAEKIYIQPTTGVQENQDIYFDGIHYKSMYHLKDTIPCNDRYYSIDSIDAAWKKLYCTSIDTLQKRYMPQSVMKDLLPYMGRNNVLLIDFWGTWCAPCISSLPRLKAVYREMNTYCSFVSVCFDAATKRQTADSLIKKHEIPWPQLFDEDSPKPENKRPYTLQLNITLFPTYLLIKKDGEILFQGNGDKGLDAFTHYMSRIPKTASHID